MFGMHDTTTAAPRRRVRPLHRVLQAALVLIGLLLLGYVILYVTKGRFLKGPFTRIASSYAGRPVSVGGDFQLYFNPHIKFLAEDLRIANPAWAKDGALFSAGLIDSELNVLPLLTGQQHFRFVTIADGVAGLERDAAGRVTWDFGRGGDITIPAIDRAAITGTRLHYIDDLRKADVRIRIGDVAAAAANGRNRVAGPLTFTGDGKAMGAPFTLRGALTTPDTTITGGRTGLDLHVGVADSRIDVSGTLPGATRLEGSDLKVSVAGRNLQTPFKLIGVVVPATRPYRLAADLTKNGPEFRFTRMTGRIGDSDIGGRLTIARRGERIRLDGALASKTLDILDVGPLLGYSPAALDAKGGKGAITVEGGHPRILPDAPLAVDGLDAFDAKIQYGAAHVRTGNAPIDHFYVDVDLDHKLLRLAPLAFDLGGGRLAAAVLLNARVHPVVTDYDIQLSQVPLGTLLTSFDVANSGATASVRGRVQLRGVGDSVRKSLGSSTGRIALVFPTGTLWIRNVELAKLDVQNFLTAFIGKKLKKPSEIRCGLVAFTVTNGTAVADPIFFDTKRSIFRGKGGFDFKDESLHLSFEGDSKEFSLFSGQSPIGIGGYFAAPAINPISGELIARTLGAVALGVVATPLAAILTFVDLGEQKNTDCTPVLAAKRGAAVAAADKAAEKR